MNLSQIIKLTYIMILITFDPLLDTKKKKLHVLTF